MRTRKYVFCNQKKVYSQWAMMQQFMYLVTLHVCVCVESAGIPLWAYPSKTPD